MRKNTGILFRTAGIILLILTGCNQGGNEGTFTVRIEKEAVAENIGVEEESRTEKIKIPKNWTKQTKTFSDSELNDTQISQYIDETGNVVGYEVVQGENKFAYSLEHAEYQFKEMQGEIPRYHWNNDEEFLYEAVLSEEEKKDMSTTVNLIGRVDVENYAEYKDFLPFGGEAEWALPRAYSYTSDGANISLEQAIDLCMEILVLEGVKKENIKRVMEGEQYGMYVGYSFNLRNWQRDYGDTTDIVWVDNCIGVKADSIIHDGMKMNIVLYERHRSELDESYNHTAATGQYLIGLKEKVIIVE
ncbi:MAG: hypothetical protein ACI4D2_00660 [Lachnospiraceae bacterium]